MSTPWKSPARERQGLRSTAWLPATWLLGVVVLRATDQLGSAIPRTGDRAPWSTPAAPMSEPYGGLGAATTSGWTGGAHLIFNTGAADPAAGTR